MTDRFSKQKANLQCKGVNFGVVRLLMRMKPSFNSWLLMKETEEI